MKAHSTDQPTFFRQLDEFIQSIPPRIDSSTIDHKNNSTQANSSRGHELLHNYLLHYSLDLTAHCESHEIWQSDINGKRIVEQRWHSRQPNGQHLILCHGYFDHTALYGKVIDWALSKGYCLHSFDLPGHGLSGGKRAAIDSFDEYSQVLNTIINREAYPHYHCIGQSTGCAVILNTILNRELTPCLEHLPEQTVLLAPLVRSIHWQVLRWGYFFIHTFLPAIKRTFAESSHDKNFNHFLHTQDPLQASKLPLNWLGAMDEWIEKIGKAEVNTQLSCTIIQGTGDNTVDYKYNLPVIQSRLPHTHIHYIDNAFHHLANESQEYWQQVKALLNESL
ncbi:MAG: alpha/beta hydrolase [Cellvibrionaceae bacterium]